MTMTGAVVSQAAAEYMKFKSELDLVQESVVRLRADEIRYRGIRDTAGHEAGKARLAAESGERECAEFLNEMSKLLAANPGMATAWRHLSQMPDNTRRYLRLLADHDATQTLSQQLWARYQEQDAICTKAKADRARAGAYAESKEQEAAAINKKMAELLHSNPGLLQEIKAGVAAPAEVSAQPESQAQQDHRTYFSLKRRYDDALLANLVAHAEFAKVNANAIRLEKQQQPLPSDMLAECDRCRDVVAQTQTALATKLDELRKHVYINGVAVMGTDYVANVKPQPKKASLVEIKQYRSLLAAVEAAEAALTLATTKLEQMKADLEHVRHKVALAEQEKSRRYSHRICMQHQLDQLVKAYPDLADAIPF